MIFISFIRRKQSEKLEALEIAVFIVMSMLAVGASGLVVIILLLNLKLITWVCIAITAVITILVWIGIYQYDKHF